VGAGLGGDLGKQVGGCDVDEVLGERRSWSPAGVHQHTEVAEFLRNLVEGGDQPGHDADAHVDDERSAHGEPSD